MHQLLQISSLIDNLKTFYQRNPEATRTPYKIPNLWQRLYIHKYMGGVLLAQVYF